MAIMKIITEIKYIVFALIIGLTVGIIFNCIAILFTPVNPNDSWAIFPILGMMASIIAISINRRIRHSIISSTIGCTSSILIYLIYPYDGNIPYTEFNFIDIVKSLLMLIIIGIIGVISTIIITAIIILINRMKKDYSKHELFNNDIICAFGSAFGAIIGLLLSLFIVFEILFT
jgi:hypothetical protein